MNKLKSVLSFTFLAAAVIGVGCGGMLCSAPPRANMTVFADYVDDTVNETVLDDYFVVDGLTQGTFFHKTASDTGFSVRLNTEKAEVANDDNETSPNFKYYYSVPGASPTTYYYFLVNAVTFSIDGVTIPDKKASGNDIGFDTSNLILNSTGSTDFLDAGDNVTSQTINFKVVYEKGGKTRISQPVAGENDYLTTENKLSPTPQRTVYLGDTFTDSEGRERSTEGKLEIRISYSFVISEQIAVGRNSEKFVGTETPLTPAIIRTLYLNEDNYVTQLNEPKLEYDTNTLTRTNVTTSEAATHKFNYFYNYQSNQIPWISYNPNYIRLSVTKTQNNATISDTIVYDPDDKKINKDANGNEHIPSFLYDIKEEENGNLKVYFNDVGQYGLAIDFVHINTNDKTTYVVDRAIKGQLYQNVYIFGAQAFFTNRAENKQSEFKDVENFAATISADITSYLKDNKYASLLPSGAETNEHDAEGSCTCADCTMKKLVAQINTDKINIVSTNQTPVKFAFNLNSQNISVYSKLENDDKGWQRSAESVTKTFSNPGEYFVRLSYSFAPHTTLDGAASDATFTQYFYFKINKPVPVIKIYAVDKNNTEKELMSKDYTNAERVKIIYENYGGKFDSEATFEISKKDFKNPSQSFENRPFTFRVTTRQDASGNEYQCGEYVEEGEGTYTVSTYYSFEGVKQKVPVTKSFTIDREAIDAIEPINAYTVQTYGLNKEYQSDPTPISDATNQPFILTWQQTKRSGATTNAYVKYYPLQKNNIYSSNGNLSGMIQSFLGTFQSLATDKSLNFRQNASWDKYDNATAVRNGVIPNYYVKSDAGLYIFQIVDQAGNTAVKIVLFDDSTPYFAMYKAGSSSGEAGGYSIVSTYYTTSTDATVYWGEKKAIFIDYDPNSNDVAADRNGDESENSPVYQALMNFFNGKTHNYSLPQIADAYKGDYYEVELEDYASYKGLSGKYEPINASSMEIQSSFKVYYTGDESVINYYYSTSDNVNNYVLKVKEDGSTERVVSINGTTIENEGTLKEAKVYKRSVNGENTAYYYSAPISSDTNLHKVYSTEVVTKPANFENSEFKEVNFVDMEGTYVFLLRDKSNTLGRDYPKDSNGYSEEAFLNHASAYQYVKVTGDVSGTKIYFTDGDDTIELTYAAFSNSGVTENDEAKNLSFRESYYEPTCIQKVLSVSFTPTTTTSAGKTQIDKVTLQYFPYETQKYAHLNAWGNPVVEFYQTLSTVETEPIVLYDYKNGSGDAESSEELTFSINVSSQMTKAGKYILKRTYVTGEGYITGSFDYDQRTLTALVDRYNVLSEQASVEYVENIRTYQNVNGLTLQTRVIENILEVTVVGETNFPDNPTFKFYAKNGEEETELKLSQINANIGYYNLVSEEDSKKPDIILDTSAIVDYVLKVGEDKIQDYSVTPSKSYRSLESVVGSDIFVNMYDGMSENGGSQVSITFPNYSGILPSGDSFYTDNKSDWDPIHDETASKFTTNKLPVSLYIPSVKYTLYNLGQWDDAIEYSSVLNETLNYYDKTYTNSVINSYELRAEITVFDNEGNIIKYYSNGSTYSGFLKFVDDKGQDVSNFTTAGVYIVNISQGNYSEGVSANSFKKNYQFSFTVLSSSPEFSISANGAQLNSLQDRSQNEVKEIYYTNASDIRVSWNDTDSPYIANIDKTQIRLIIMQATYKISIVDNKVSVFNDTNDELPDFEVGMSYSKTGNQNRLIINLSALDAYYNGSEVDITMQFENHNSDYYSTKTKAIYIDLAADATSLNPLIDKLPSSSALTLDRSTLRRYKDASGGDITTGNPNNDNFVASYNISQDATSPLYRYSYMVDSNFFITLRDKVMANANITSPQDYVQAGCGAWEAYYRIVDNPYNTTSETSDEETSYENFIPSTFNNITDSIPSTAGDYVEVVERDRAGNMTIYLVYLYDQDQTDEGQEGSYQGIEIKDESTFKLASDAQIATDKLSLYASTSTTISRFNFLGDEWIRFAVNDEEYLLSPIIPQGNVFHLPNTTTSISLNSVLSSFSSSTVPISIRVLNRATGVWHNFTITLLNEVALVTTLSNSDSEYISISYSNAVYPVNVSIFQQTIQNEQAVLTANLSNNPNKLENLTNADYTYLSGWANKDGITVSVDAATNRIVFRFNRNPSVGVKVRYEIEDNFGNILKPAHIFGIVQPNEITSSGNIYQTVVNDFTTGNQNEIYYIATKNLVYSFNNLIHNVTVEKWDNIRGRWSSDASVLLPNDYISRTTDNITTYTFAPQNDTFNQKFRLIVNELDGTEQTNVKTVYLQLYQVLPHLLDKLENANDYLSTFTMTDSSGINITKEVLVDRNSENVFINGKTYSVSLAGITFAKSIRLTFTDPAQFAFPYSIYIYKEDGSLGEDFVPINSGSRFAESGVYYILFKYDELLLYEDRVYKVEILDSNNEYYRVTNNGHVVNRAGAYYNDGSVDNPEYYIVNVKYPDESRAIEIVPNTYQKIVSYFISEKPEEQSREVVTLQYVVSNVGRNGDQPLEQGLHKFFKKVFITFVPPTQSPVGTMYLTYNFSDMPIPDSINDKSSYTAVPPDPGIESIKLVYSKNRGIDSNLINLSVLKDGVPYTPTIKQMATGDGEEELMYAEFSISGTYTISFTDVAGNRQMFATGLTQQSYEFNLVLLKDVSFFMTYTDVDGNEQNTDPIQKGVFNSEVTLSVIKKFNSVYYTQASVGEKDSLIHVTRNGVPYTNYEYSSNETLSSFKFSKPGYYSVYFSATSLATGLELRETVYTFAIVEPEESRYAFEFSPYQSYYVLSIIKGNSGDITRDNDGNLVADLQNTFQTAVGSDNKRYLKNFVTSVSDEGLLGSGRYIVTISTNKNLNRDDYSKVTTFSFAYWINSESVPISVSINEGTSTNKNISVSFNAERVFTSVGECDIYVGTKIYHINSETIAELGTITETLSTTGVHYITVMSMSGSVLYRYKVEKTEPLNGWAIAAIVIGGIVLIAVIIIIVKLRKRIKVK